MRVTIAMGFIGVLAIVALFIFEPVYADTIVYQQPIATTQVNSNTGSVVLELSSLDSGGNPISGVGLWLYGNMNLRVRLHAKQAGMSNNCNADNTPRYDASIIASSTTAGGQLYVADFNGLGANATPSGGWCLSIFALGGSFKMFGTSTPNQFTFGGTGSPYLYVWTTEGPEFDTTSRITAQTQPTNGATTPTTQATFQFSWYNSGYELYSIAQTEVSDITNGYQYTPQQSSAALTGYGTTTQVYTLQPNHLHLWRACLLNPNTNQKTCSGFYSLNVVGASASSSVPVLPDVTSSNATSTLQSSIWGFLSVPQLLQSKLPFAYFFQVADLLNELQATSTAAVEPVIFDYESLDISTTTKNSLPAQWEAFSTTTVTQYIPEVVLDTWRLLMSSVLWFGFAMYVYYSIGKLFSGTTNAV